MSTGPLSASLVSVAISKRMLSGLKFIPRNQVEREQHSSDDDVRKESKKSARKKGKSSSRKKSSRHSSSGDESIERIKKSSKRKKKWYASDEDSSSQSESDHSLDYEERKSRRKKRKQNKKHKDGSEDEYRSKSDKKSRGRRKEMPSSESDGSESDDSSGEARSNRRGKKSQEKDIENRSPDNETAKSLGSLARKEMGLDWMLRPKDASKENPLEAVDDKIEKVADTEVEKVNPRELNPYFNDNGSGYPHESEEATPTGNQLLSSSLVGDGGASWRLKALKRAREQAAREGRKLDEVVEDRWGSFSHLAVSVASRAAAPTRAHLHAIKNRRKGVVEEERTVAENYDGKGESPHHSRMKVPKVQDSLSWGKRKLKMSSEDSEVVSAAISGLNKFKDDGSFLDQFVQKKIDVSDQHSAKSPICSENRVESSSTSKEHKVPDKDVLTGKPTLTANQLAAKVMQLRMKGQHEEAEKLMREAETLEVKQVAGERPQGTQVEGRKGRYVVQDESLRQKRREGDADLHLAKSIMRNHQYSMSGRADDEYDNDEGPRKKSRKKGGGADDHKSTEVTNFSQRMLTQKERCQFCFENPNRPKHLVVAIANFAYLSLPQWEPVAQGHCCILTMQHESATRSVDDNVWDEIRNFKKCLLMMFAKQEKDVLFLETVVGIARQRRHCMVECIPVPREIAKQAPVYFKKAIDEAEDEWSQHNAKKLIDTSQKGLRGSIPKNFPYFYVEFGLDKGFVHVIDNENDFESSFGLNVVRGMLQLPAEDMHRRRKHESVDKQKQAAASFSRDWEPFDWTKQL